MKKTMKKVLTVALIVLMLLAAVPALAAGKTLKQGATVVTTGREFIRTDAGMNGIKLGTVPKGQKLTLTADSKADASGRVWYKVSFGGKTGWISSRYTTQNTAKAASRIRTTGNVHLRKNGTTQAASLAIVPKGTKLTYGGTCQTDTRGVTWYKVSFSGKTGWISGKYVKFC